MAPSCLLQKEKPHGHHPAQHYVAFLHATPMSWGFPKVASFLTVLESLHLSSFGTFQDKLLLSGHSQKTCIQVEQKLIWDWHGNIIFWHGLLLGSGWGSFWGTAMRPLFGLQQSQTLRFLAGDEAGGLLLSVLIFWYSYFILKYSPENYSEQTPSGLTLTLPQWRYLWCVIVLNKIMLYSGAGEINVFYCRIGAWFISTHCILGTAIAGSQ